MESCITKLNDFFGIILPLNKATDSVLEKL